MIYLLIIFIVVLIIYFFQQDKSRATKTNVKHGGLKVLFPNFVNFCEKVYEDYGENGEMKMQLAKEDDRYLEYKTPVLRNGKAIAHIFYGIENSIGTYAYCYIVSEKTGYKHGGYMTEMNKENWKDIYDPTFEEYFNIYDKLLTKIAYSADFKKLGIDKLR